MKKLLLTTILILASLTAQSQICSTGVTSLVFSPVSGSDDLQLEVYTSCCQIHHFDNYTITTSGSDHIINLCYRDTGLLMPSDIVTNITLAGLNAGGTQNFTFNVNYYYGLSSEDCSSNSAYNGTFPISLATPVVQSRTFQLSTEGQSVTKTNLFPNPNSGDFALQLPSDEEQAQVTVTDLSGKQVFTTANYFSGDSVHLKGLSKGLYFVKVMRNDAVEILKFIIE